MPNMRISLKSIFFMLILIIMMSNLIIAEDLNLMPYPKSVNILDGKFRIDEKFHIEYNLETTQS